MSSESIGSWIKQAKAIGQAMPQSGGVKVVKRAPKSKGNLIMEIAEKIRPWILKMFEGVRDENGMVVQPARVRAISLNVAQSIVNDQEPQEANA